MYDMTDKRAYVPNKRFKDSYDLVDVDYDHMHSAYFFWELPYVTIASLFLCKFDGKFYWKPVMLLGGDLCDQDGPGHLIARSMDLTVVQINRGGVFHFGYKS